MENQRQIFHLLHDFAFKVSVRYSGIESDPIEIMYKAFARLFHEGPQLKSARLDLLKETIKDLIITICIEREGLSKNIKERLSETLPFNENDIVEHFHQLSNKQIIDTLRTIPFSFRMVYNMSVIDGYKEQTISSKLQMSVGSVLKCLRLAREHLAELLKQTVYEETELS